MSSDEQSEKECPLCMEVLEIDDVDFYPCKCEYQICRFCWHRLRTDENGLCPACRQPYPENPVNFKPLSASDVLKIKSEKKQKQQQQRIKVSETRKHLSSYRVLQKNLVYVVGLSARVADPDILKKPDYFGKYGRILKVAVGTSASANGPQSASCTAYVTYVKFEDALRAIQAVNNAQLDGRIVKASLGTTKYCSSFLRSQPCHKPECMYLHDVADNEVSFTKDDMHLGRHADYEKKLIETTLLREKAHRERLCVIANNTRKHSQNKSGDRGTVSHSTSAGASPSPDANDRDKMVNSNTRQPERSGSAPRTQPPSLREKEENATRDTDRVPVAAGDKSKSPDRAAHQSQPTAKDKRVVEISEPPEGDAEKSTQDSLPVNENRAPSTDHLQSAKMGSDVQSSMPLRSRLVQWTSPERRTAASTQMTACAPLSELPLSGTVDAKGSETSSMDYAVEELITNEPDVPDWQRALGFSLGDAHDTLLDSSATGNAPLRARTKRPSRPSICSDDELGFDPFSESSKGLADLLEEEKSRAPRPPPSSASMPSVMSALPLAMHCGWPSAGSLNGAGYENTGFGSTQHSNSGPHLFPPATTTSTLSPLDYFAPLSMTTAGQPSMQANPSFYMNCQQTPNHSYGMTQPQQRCSQVNGRTMMYADPPPGLSSLYPQQRYSPFATGNPSPSQTDTSHLSELQEGFKALLPNVNVTFVSELNAAGYPMTRSHAPSAMQPQQPQQHCNQPTSMLGCYGQSGYSYPQPVPQYMPPPPGFSKR